MSPPSVCDRLRRRRDGNHCSTCYKNDESTFGAGYVEIGADLSPVVIERMSVRIHVAFPVDDHNSSAILVNGDGIGDPDRYGFRVI